MAGIPNARDARTQAVKNLTVLREIHAIEEAILLAVDGGELFAEVSDGTVMTEADNLLDSTETVSESYYNVWQALSTDETKSEEMQAVIDYFQNLGYNIARRQNATTLTTFKWVLNW